MPRSFNPAAIWRSDDAPDAFVGDDGLEIENALARLAIQNDIPEHARWSGRL
jgi:hypothetical protein